MTLSPEGREAVEANLLLAQRAIERARTVVDDERADPAIAAWLAGVERDLEEIRALTAEVRRLSALVAARKGGAA